MKRKRIVLIVMLAFLLVIPITTNARQIDEKTTSTNFKETLQMSGIELKNKNYKETDDQITIYMFRSSVCEYAKAVLEYLNSISDEYGKYFKLKAYDVEQKENMDFYAEVADFIGQEIRGVPFYIIGETEYLGFSEVEKDVIAETIKKEYNKKNRYDVLKEMQKQKDKDSNKKDESNKKEQKKLSITKKRIITTISLSLGIIILITAGIIINNKNLANKKMKIKEKLMEKRTETNKKNSTKHSKDNKKDKLEKKNNKTKTKKNTNKKSSRKKTKEE